MSGTVSMHDYVQNRPAPDAEVLVDLREPYLYAFGTVPGAVNIPLDALGQLYRLPKDRTIYVFCQSGEASVEIAELLDDAGYTAYHLSGGYREYLLEHLQTPDETEEHA